MCFLRKKLKLKVRQPLSSVSVILNKAKEMSFEEGFLSILKTELNVKSVDFVTQSSSFVEKKLTPNFPVLGKKHKNLMKELVVLISNLSKEEVSFFEKKSNLSKVDSALADTMSAFNSLIVSILSGYIIKFNSNLKVND